MSLTAFEHLSNYPNQGLVLHRRCDSFFVAQLSCDRCRGTVGSLLDLHIDPETRWKGLLEADAHPQADDGRQRAMSDGRRDEDGDYAQAWRSGQGFNLDIWKIDDGEGA